MPPTTRSFVSAKLGQAADLTGTALRLSGRVIWAVAASALLVGVPFALAYGEDQTYAAAEAEERMRALGGELLTAGGGENGGPGTAKDAGAELQQQLAQSGRAASAQQPL